MNSFAVSPSEIDLECVCRLDDVQPFYKKALVQQVQKSAIRLVAILKILQSQGNAIATALLEQNEDVETLTQLFIQYRELDALAQALVYSYTSNNLASINARLNELYALLTPFGRGLHPGLSPLENTSIAAHSIIHYPTAGTVAVAQVETNLGSATAEVVSIDLHGSNFPETLTVIPDIFTHTGIRISVALSQPSSAGQEFQFIEQGEPPTQSAPNAVQKAINSLAFLDMGLITSFSDLMTLFTVCPSLPHIRQAGSVSSLPGWAWQDVDLSVDPLKEYCHLCVQITHEFFHTKVNLVEKSIPLYEGDGNLPEVFSPWKDRMRPQRQVIHALMTFSAGAAVWARLAKLDILKTDEVVELAEEYWRENVAFAKLGHKGLVAEGTLTDAGKSLIDACVENLEASIEDATS